MSFTPNSSKVWLSFGSTFLELNIYIGCLSLVLAKRQNLLLNSENLVFFVPWTIIYLPPKIKCTFKIMSFSGETVISELFYIFNWLKVWLSVDFIFWEPKKKVGSLSRIPAWEQKLFDKSENLVPFFALRTIL